MPHRRTESGRGGENERREKSKSDMGTEKEKNGKELLHLLFIRFSYFSFYFSLICLYRNRDILVNVLKRNKRQTRVSG